MYVPLSRGGTYMESSRSGGIAMYVPYLILGGTYMRAILFTKNVHASDSFLTNSVRSPETMGNVHVLQWFDCMYVPHCPKGTYMRSHMRSHNYGNVHVLQWFVCMYVPCHSGGTYMHMEPVTVPTFD